MARHDYTAIEDYGAIGNLQSVALVSRHGSIDWCCFPGLDSASVFGAILDVRRGGRWCIAPAGVETRADQSYIEATNVLETSWRLDGSQVVVTDFMPLRGDISALRDPGAAPCIYRVLRSLGGSCDVDVEWAPRFDYARADVRVERAGASFVAAAGDARLTLDGIGETARIEEDADGGPVVRARLTISPGEPLPLLCSWVGGGGVRLEDWEAALRRTCRAWQRWLTARDAGEHCDFGGDWQWLVDRSGLALKLLTYPRTGAIAAAATTSLPEEIGGVRNWDYRFTWIRDASFTAQALVALGHRDEAIAFLRWAEDVTMGSDGTAGKLRLMYTLYGESHIPESELDHLDGYRGSRPVRIGNKAAEQFQLDIYGELLDAAYEMVRLGVEIDGDEWSFLASVADQACARWQEKDYGIWEVRSEAQHFVYSKLMVYVALDRALRLAKRFGFEADERRWRSTRKAVRESILENGYNQERRAFVQAYDSKAFDAANLHILLEGFLPPDDPRVQSTLDRYLDELTEQGLVYRYRTSETDDGLEGSEGAFGLATFWMVDALALSGRIDEAWEMFEGLAHRANHVGLYSEQFDPGSSAFLGNFPQAFTHIGLINSAVYIAHAEGRPTPSPPPLGSAEERREWPDDDPDQGT
jgi:GH15 family glucan-1,4-alpha-glucosidase